MMFESNDSVAGPAVALTGNPQQTVAVAPAKSAIATIAAPSASTSMPGPFHLAGSLFIVIAVIFLAAFLLRRVQALRGGGQGGVILRGGLQVGARERVLLIEAHGRRVLVGVAPGSVRPLHVFDVTEGRASEVLPVQPAAFAEKLKTLLRAES
jgi:flagellar protein FliO/FliZ